jgi:hypothetical protein
MRALLLTALNRRPGEQETAGECSQEKKNLRSSELLSPVLLLSSSPALIFAKGQKSERQPENHKPQRFINKTLKSQNIPAWMPNPMQIPNPPSEPNQFTNHRAQSSQTVRAEIIALTAKEGKRA